MRVVTVQHFGSFKPYTFLVDFEVKPHDVLIADANNDNQYVYALTSDYEIHEQDASKTIGVKPYKRIISKVENTCYCNGTRASEVPFSLSPVTYYCGRRWVSPDEYMPKEDTFVVARTRNGDLYIVIRKNERWIESYSGRPIEGIKEWLNVSLEERGELE